MRNVKIVVGGIPNGEQLTFAYPKGEKLGRYLTPKYKCAVSGTNDSGKAVTEQFDVLRFGVYCKDGKTASVVGLHDQQTHVIKAWIPTYKVHSSDSKENGAWHVYDNFLVHDGPDSSKELFATIGCIEIMGVQGFFRFNNLIIALSRPKSTNRSEQLLEIGKSGTISITYEKATRPPLKKAD